MYDVHSRTSIDNYYLPGEYQLEDEENIDFYPSLKKQRSSRKMKMMASKRRGNDELVSPKRARNRSNSACKDASPGAGSNRTH